ncbi:alphabeta hydrolase [Pseudozyma hubeiensis SY62]|uniref:Alphabeta hydrolase n=1 Tax=Pseudozyma hubeiensis (strain SY62) TaxID=1305764 RepID=R9NVR6_PSEHS|nr:alphabeta hydrolase [Pseudozyma hubeiensis SY62]GAC92569.1 alphabeta hydrolase [Pseudozyma hubeiensis SY62]
MALRLLCYGIRTSRRTLRRCTSAFFRLDPAFFCRIHSAFAFTPPTLSLVSRKIADAADAPVAVVGHSHPSQAQQSFTSSLSATIDFLRVLTLLEPEDDVFTFLPPCHLRSIASLRVSSFP